VTPLLWSMVFLGLVCRVVNILVLSPLNPTSTDAQRHVHDALNLAQLEPIAALDLPMYQLWLGGVLSNDHLAVLTQMLLSLLTPLIWWLWMRLCLPRGRWALAGFAIFTLMPSWSAIFSFFMPETILLPLFGLALCSSWLADKYRTMTPYMVSAVFWGLAITTKPTVAACFLAILIWQSRHLLKRKRKELAIFAVSAQIIIVLATYAIVPWRNYQNFQAWIFSPAFLPYNQIYYLSGKRSLHAKALFNGPQGNERYAEFSILAPTLTPECRPLEPVSEWQSCRVGEYYAQIDYRRSSYYPKVRCPLSKRLQMTFENWLFFFFSDSWPDNVLNNWMCLLEHCMRWVWLPLTLALLIMAGPCRIYTMPVLMVLITTAVFMMQQSWILEGRYRKPWEGLLIVASLDVLARRRRSTRQRGHLDM
jgi:hypothetical protein